MRNIFRISAIAAVLGAALTVSAFAADGWTQENGNWVYYKNGDKVYNSWQTSKDGSYYYLDSDGNMAVSTMIDGERYVDADGKMVTNSWRQLDSNWYYFDASGKIIRNKSKQINGVYYFFNDDGYMATGWVEDDEGNWYYCEPSDGQRLTSTWKYLVPDEKITPDETDATDTGTYWYYFLSNGKMAKAESSDSYKEYTISDNRFAFDEYGRMSLGWVKLEDTSPAIAGYKYYNDDTAIGTYGAAHVGWLSTYPPENADLGDDVQWYYFDSRGIPSYGTDVSTGDNDETLYAKLKRITRNGKTYSFLFNEYGNPVYGLRKVQRTNGTVTSMYFGTKQESCLQLGEKNITEADGTTWAYHFESNGYGTNGVKNNKLYYMGKLQKAVDDTYAYYTVDGKTYLVNKSGAIVKNHNSKKEAGEVDYKSDSSGLDAGGSAAAEEPLTPEFQTSE